MKDFSEKVKTDFVLKECGDPVKRVMELAVKNRRKSLLPRLVFYVNAHVASLWWWLPRFRMVFRHADAIYADGWGGVLFLRLFGRNCKKRQTAPDFFDRFCRLAIKNKTSVFFLGGKREVLEKFIGNIRGKHPDLMIGGFCDGYFDNTKKIIEMINDSAAEMLIVGMGSDKPWGIPKQEEWSVKNRKKIKVSIVWCTGSFFDNYPRKKEVEGNWYFEWWSRIVKKPKKMILRYAYDFLSLLWITFWVIWSRLKKELLGRKVVCF